MKIPCPFKYSTGKHCEGHIVAIKGFKCQIGWEIDGEDKNEFLWDTGRHYHFYCSEKSNHAAFNSPDSDQLKFRWNEIDSEIQEFLLSGKLIGEGYVSEY